MKFIKSKDNDTIKQIHSLSVKKYREQLGLFILEGEKVCKEAISSSVERIEQVIIKEGAEDKYLHLVNNLNTICVSVEVFNFLSSTISPQDIMLVVKSCFYKLSNCSSGNILVLDHLQDPGNLGTIIRSAIASGFYDIVLIDSADPYSDKTIRSASGTIMHAKLYKATTENFVDFCTRKNYNIVIAEANKQSVFDKSFKINRPFALVIGNEGNGVSDEIKNKKQTSVSIPMDKRVESLNAGVSASILMFLLNCKEK